MEMPISGGGVMDGAEVYAKPGLDISKISRTFFTVIDCYNLSCLKIRSPSNLLHQKSDCFQLPLHSPDREEVSSVRPH
jgi:hypothetical protein